MKTFETPLGNFTLDIIGHASFHLVWQGKNIFFDPYSEVADFSKYPLADLIIITHNHYDHLDMSAISKITKADTLIICDSNSSEVLKDTIVLRYGESYNYNGIIVAAHPAYNIKNLREDGKPYHPRGFVNGYSLNFKGFKFYVAGDTELIPEMNSLRDIDLALMPKNLPYTMSDSQFIEAANIIKPRFLYATHYFELDKESLQKRLNKDITLLND